MLSYFKLAVLGFLLVTASARADGSSDRRAKIMEQELMEAQLNRAVVAAKKEIAAAEKAVELMAEYKKTNVQPKLEEVLAMVTQGAPEKPLKCLEAGGPCTILYQGGCCSGKCYPVFLWLTIGICQ